MPYFRVNVAPRKTAIPKQIEKQIFQEAGSACPFCGEKHVAVLHIHHIIPRAEGGPNTPENLLLVCASCHQKIHTEIISSEQVYSTKRLLAKNAQQGVFGMNFLRFAEVRIALEQCLWGAVSTKDHRWGFHELPCQLSEDEIGMRISDPILDITLLNNHSQAITILAIGFDVIKISTKLKGLPASGKILVTDTYNLDVHRLAEGKMQMLTLNDPVYMDTRAPYRFRLRLSNYAPSVPGNQSVIRLVIETSVGVFVSDTIYMGVF